MRPQQPYDVQHAALEAGLDVDTVQFGTEGPFETWEGDHTAMVHVLWHARHEGLDLASDADRIATLIEQSRCMAAVRHFAATGAPVVRGFATQGDGLTGTHDELVAVLEAAAATGGDLTGDADRTGELVRTSGWFAAVQASAALASA